MDLLSEVITLAFGSIDDPAAMTQLIQAIAMRSGAVSAQLQIRSATGVSLVGSFNVDPGVAKDYAAYFWAHDIWADRLPRDQLSQVLAFDDFLSDDEVRASEIYNDLVRHNGDTARIAGVLAPLDEAATMQFGVHRQFSRPAFDRDVVADLQRLLPLLAHVVGARRRADHGEGRLAEQLLDADRDPALVLDSAGVLKFANRAADIALSGGTPLLRTAGIVSAPGADAPRFARALEWACSGRGGSVVRLVDAPGGVRAVAIDPLPREPRLAAVRWRDGEARRQEDLAAARSSLGLTAAESAVAEALMRGDSPAQYAKARGVQIITVRSQLRSLFAKAGVTRQAELVATLRGGHAKTRF